MPIPDDPPPGMPDWMFTFGDMMSLLLTFFILLVSMSEIRRDDRFQGIADSIQERFGSETTPQAIAGESRLRNPSLATLVLSGRSRRQQAILSMGHDSNLIGREPKVRILRPGERTTVGGVITFTSGQIDLNDEQREELGVIGQSLRDTPRLIEVRSLAGNAQPVGEVANGLEVAFQRARRVSEFLQANLQINPQRIRISLPDSNAKSPAANSAVKDGERDCVEVFLLDERLDVAP